MIQVLKKLDQIGQTNYRTIYLTAIAVESKSPKGVSVSYGDKKSTLVHGMTNFVCIRQVDKSQRPLEEDTFDRIRPVFKL